MSSTTSLEYLDTVLTKVYHSELTLPYELSKWNVTKIYKAIFKWLTVKIDQFSMSGVTFETLEMLYKSTVNNLASDTQDSQSDTIKAVVYKFMKALNEKREDFEYETKKRSAKDDKSKKKEEFDIQDKSEDEGQDELYNFENIQKRQPMAKAKEINAEIKDKTMKNNFVNIIENERENNIRDNQESPISSQPHNHKENISQSIGAVYANTPEFEHEVVVHPLKCKYLESFEEILKTKSKFI